jgi:hypothetical protein
MGSAEVAPDSAVRRDGRLRSWWRRRTEPPAQAPSTPPPDQVDAIVDILSALEYGKKKEERELIDAVFAQHGVARRPTKVEVAPMIAAAPGFEKFFLAVMGEVRPFALMLTDVYEFLGRHATVARRASTFLVSTAGAEAALDFSLASFPRHLVRLLSAGQVEESTIELALPSNVNDPDRLATGMSEDLLAKRWQAVDSHWDNDFYDSSNEQRDGFFRLASYATLMRTRMEPSEWAHVAALMEPIIDRLAALLDAFEASGLDTPFGREFVNLRRLNGDLNLQKHSARAHAVEKLPTGAQLDVTLSQGRFEATLRYSFERLSLGWAVAVHLWRTPELVRTSEDLGNELSLDVAFRPGAFAAALERAATAFCARLDDVAPIVGSAPRQATLEQLIEFTELPFWKHRWFLYELWTLIRVLRVASTVGTVTLEGVAQVQPGVMEWVLPGGMARSPVARVTSAQRSVSVWTQLKSQHPATNAGLEPDLRIRTDGLPERDLFLIENKDRLSIGAGAIAEVVQRYVTGTKASHSWFINYEMFPLTATGLEAAYPGRGVRVVSHFRPDHIPSDFEPALAGVLRDALQVPAAPKMYEIVLTWTAPPADLDLHAWVQRDGERHQVFYGALGSLLAPPFASLSGDQRSGGTETISISDSHFDRVTVAVCRYSGSEPISRGRPSIKLFGDGEELGERRASDELNSTKRPEAWWRVVEIDSAGELTWLDELSEEPPFT